MPLSFLLFLFLRFYLFTHEGQRAREQERERERGRDTVRDIDRGRSRLHVGNLTWDPILGIQDHALGQRQALNR